MRVLFVCGIYPPDAGGPALYARRLSREMVRNGHEVRVITLADAAGPFDDDGVLVERIQRFESTGHTARSRRYWNLIRKHGRWAQLIYDNGCPWDTGFPCLVAKPFTRRPIVVKITGDVPWELLRFRRLIDDSLDDFQTKKYPAKYAALRWTQRFIVQRANHVITPSRYLQKLVLGWGADPGRVSVILNALNEGALDYDRSAPGPHLPVPEDSFKVCTVARLVPHKGIDYIVDAVSNLPGASLLIIGDGYERPLLDDQIKRLHVQDRVALLGRLPHHDVLRVLSRSDLFVLNSEYEGLPHSVLEAFTLGVPAVVTDICGNPEVVTHGHNGFLVPVRDARALQARIKELMDNPGLRATFVQRSHEKLKDFSWRRLYNSTMALFEDVIRKAGGKP